jgi:hypothetical protein
VASQTRIVVNDLTAFTERAIKRLALEVHAGLVAAPSEGGTPVDTGWARANWIPSIGVPATEPDGEVPMRGESTIAGGQAQSGLARVAATYRLRQGPIFISNNVPYIGRLNDGHSRQAPSGFVQRAILKAVRKVSIA